MAKRKAKRRNKRNSYVWIFFVAIIAMGAVAFLYPAHPARRAPGAVRPRPVDAPLAVPVHTAASASIARTAPPMATSPPPRIVSSAPLAQASGTHRLAIIIDDCGQWPDTERALIALPIPITMSVMPKERYTQAIAQEASAAGKGVMLHLPMEPLANIDPGAGKITTSMTDGQIARQVQDDVSRVPLAKGVNNHEGSKASADLRVMQAVASALAPDGLFFIDSRTSAASVAAGVAAQAGMQTASRDVFLDNVDDVDAIKIMLHHAADLAEKNGSAIAIGHPRQATLEAIRELIPQLQTQGISFALASDLVH